MKTTILKKSNNNALVQYGWKLWVLGIALLSLFASLKFFIFVVFGLLCVAGSFGGLQYFWKNIIIPITIVSILIIYSIALGNEVPYIFYEGRDILITAIVLVILNAICVDNSNYRMVISLIKLFACLIGFSKLLIIIYAIKTGVNASAVMDRISEFTGWQLMTYDLDESSLARIQFPVDLATCFLVYFFLGDLLKKTSFFTVGCFLLVMLSVLMTMSRAFWFITIVMIGITFAQSLRKKSSIISIVIIFFVLLAAYVSTFDTTNKILESRLSSTLNAHSDETRNFQHKLLMPKFMNRPILGEGLGYFDKRYTIKGEVNNYAYESQVLAMLAKIGILGFGAIIFYFLLTCFYFNRDGRLSTLAVKLTFFSLWMFSGMVNPLLFSVPGGLILFLTSNIANERQGWKV